MNHINVTAGELPDWNITTPVIQAQIISKSVKILQNAIRDIFFVLVMASFLNYYF